MMKFSTVAVCGALLLAVAASGIALRRPVEAQGILGARLTVSIPDATRGKKTTAIVDVTPTRAINARRVYLELRCTEIVEIGGYGLPAESDQKGKAPEKTKTVNVKKEESLFSQEFTVAGPQALAANTSQKFQAEIEIPGHLPPTFKGKNARVKWEARGAVDVRGLDPGSSWQEIQVN
jgi:hypothetical protein